MEYLATVFKGNGSVINNESSGHTAEENSKQQSVDKMTASVFPHHRAVLSILDVS